MCNSSSKCTKCFDRNAELFNEKCVCRKGYYELAEMPHICFEYNVTCSECISITDYTVLKNSKFYCKDGFFEDASFNNKVICKECGKTV